MKIYLCTFLFVCSEAVSVTVCVLLSIKHILLCWNPVFGRYLPPSQPPTQLIWFRCVIAAVPWPMFWICQTIMSGMLLSYPIRVRRNSKRARTWSGTEGIKEYFKCKIHLMDNKTKLKLNGILFWEQKILGRGRLDVRGCLGFSGWEKGVKREKKIKYETNVSEFE